MLIRRWMPMLLVVSTLLCYSRLFKAEFTFLDDHLVVQHNPRLNPPSWKNVLSFWPPFVDGRVNEVYGLYMPLTYTMWSAVASVAQTSSSHPMINSPELNPYLFHVTNILLHAAACVIVFGILVRLTQHEWGAFMGAMVFALHPVQVESVGWISGGKDVLAGVLALAAIRAYQQFVVGRTRPERVLIYAVFVLVSAGSMCSKPSGIVVFALVWVVGALMRRGAFAEPGGYRRVSAKVFMEVSPVVLLALLFGVLGALAQPAHDVPSAPLWARPFVVGDALAFYLYKLIMPFNLAVDYGRRPSAVMGQWWFYLTWIVPALAGLIVWRFRKRRPMLLAGALIFCIAAAPTLGFVTFLYQQYSTTADHYLYLPMLGVAMIVSDLFSRAKFTRGTWIVGGAVIGICAILTIIQTGVWRNDYTLFNQTLRVNPNSFMAHANLAAAAMRDGNLEMAEQHLRSARRSQPLLEPNLAELEQNFRLLSGRELK